MAVKKQDKLDSYRVKIALNKIYAILDKEDVFTTFAICNYLGGLAIEMRSSVINKSFEDAAKEMCDEHIKIYRKLNIKYN